MNNTATTLVKKVFLVAVSIIIFSASFIKSVISFLFEMIDAMDDGPTDNEKYLKEKTEEIHEIELMNWTQEINDL